MWSGHETSLQTGHLREFANGRPAQPAAGTRTVPVTHGPVRKSSRAMLVTSRRVQERANISLEPRPSAQFFSQPSRTLTQAFRAVFFRRRLRKKLRGRPGFEAKRILNVKAFHRRLRTQQSALLRHQASKSKQNPSSRI